VTTDLRVVIVEDEPLYREMLTIAIGQRQGLQVVAACPTGEAALEAMAAYHPDVLVLDVSLGGGMNGIQVGLRVRRTRPTVGIVLLSNTLKPSMLQLIPDEQLAGWSYLHKGAVNNMGALDHAIRSAAQGLVALDPSIGTRDLVPTLSKPALTARQLDVLRLMAQGHGNLTIAQLLHLSEKSVANYTNAIYERLGIDTLGLGHQPRVKAALYYVKELAQDQ